MAYGLLKIAAAPDSASSMRQFIDVVNKNFRRLEKGMSLGVTANVAVAKVGGGTRTLHFVDGVYTSYTDS